MPIAAEPDAGAEAKRPPVAPAERRAFKRSMWLVLGLCSMMFAGIFVWRDSQRVIANTVLPCGLLLAVSLLLYALWRLRRALPEGERGLRRPT